jgi:hypothetical protein
VCIGTGDMANLKSLTGKREVSDVSVRSTERERERKQGGREGGREIWRKQGGRCEKGGGRVKSRRCVAEQGYESGKQRWGKLGSRASRGWT